MKVRSCLLVCFGIITLHCIVWAAILFPAHPYIESATALSDSAVSDGAVPDGAVGDSAVPDGAVLDSATVIVYVGDNLTVEVCVLAKIKICHM